MKINKLFYYILLKILKLSKINIIKKYFIKINKMKVAILHEMLIKKWWAEKVVEKLMRMFPEAPIYTLIYDENKIWDIFPASKVKVAPTTQKIFKWTKNQRFCLPFMPMAVESLDFSEYDVVICSSSWFAHWAITKPETKFIVYYHSPARYLWDWTNEYKKDIGFRKWIKWYILNKLFLKLRQWDYIASKRVDISLANSTNVQNRIRKYYKKDSILVYPPVETTRFMPGEKWDYYIIISALTEFKKIEVAIKAFNEMPNKKLKIVWDGNYRQTLESIKTSQNIEFLWAKYGQELVSLLQNSAGLIFPWEEDFWIVPIEAQASWKAVFAYKWWWLLETVIPWITWEFFLDKNWADFVEKFEIFDNNINNNVYNEENIRNNALRFSEEEFENKIKELVYN